MPDKKEIRKELGLPLEKKLILSVSVDTKRKNLEMIRKISQMLDDSYRIVRVGVPVNDSITFKGIDDKTLVKIYNACDLFLTLSLAEGQGLPISEAFKVGLPVVCSDIPVFREVAGNAAIFVDPKSEISIINGIKESISARDELINKGLIRAELFSYNSFKQKMLDYYNKINT